MRIEKLFLTDTFHIIVFKGRSNCQYYISSGYWLCDGKNSVCTNFDTRKHPLSDMEMVGCVNSLKENKAMKLLSNAGIFAPYPDPAAKDFNMITDPVEYLVRFLNSEGWNDEGLKDVWILAPKQTKKLTGKSFPVIFNLPSEDFKGISNKELDVFMTPITKKSRSVTFKVEIPDYLYQYLNEHPNVDDRPKYKTLSCETLKGLHDEMEGLRNTAWGLKSMREDENKAIKVILISFKSDVHSMRDSLNHAYVGENININFRFFVGYKTQNSTKTGSRIFTFHNIKNGDITNHQSTGKKNYILDGWNREYKVIEWTEERERFLNELQSRFIQMSGNLNKFLSDLNEEKLNMLMAQNVLQLNWHEQK